MDFLQIIEEQNNIQDARDAFRTIVDIINKSDIKPDNRYFIKFVQKELVKLSELYSRIALVYAGQMLRNKYNKNFGSVSYLTKDPTISESLKFEDMDHYAKWIFYRIKNVVPNLKNTFLMAQTVLKYMGKDINHMGENNLKKFVKKIESYIWKINPDYNGKLFNYLKAETNPNLNVHSIDDDYSKHLRYETVNPYLTQSQKYSQKHPNSNAHQHSMRRTTGNDTERKTQRMVPNVRKDLKTPYKNGAVNNAQNQPKILTPFEMQQIAHDYNIDFNDRRSKTVKGKTNMILTPMKNGGWKLEHR